MEEQTVTEEIDLWTSEPAFIAASIAQLSGVELDRIRYWVCPCCDRCKAVYVQDARGSVWLGMTIAAHATRRGVVRLDRLDEVEGAAAALPGDDGRLLAVFYNAGLRSDLTRLFVS